MIKREWRVWLLLRDEWRYDHGRDMLVYSLGDAQVMEPPVA